MGKILWLTFFGPPCISYSNFMEENKQINIARHLHRNKCCPPGNFRSRTSGRDIPPQWGGGSPPTAEIHALHRRNC